MRPPWQSSLNFWFICAVKQLAEFHTKPVSEYSPKNFISLGKVVVNGLCYHLQSYWVLSLSATPTYKHLKLC